MEAYLFVFGCCVSFLCLGGTYSWLRRGFVDAVERPVPENHLLPEASE